MESEPVISNKSRVYLDKPYVKVFWSPEDSILMSKWSGFCTFEEIKAVGDRILDAVTFEGAQKVLYDARQIEVLDDNSQRYISGTFTQEMISSGVKFAAAVFPDDIFAKFSIDDIQRDIQERRISNVTYFQSISNAFNWLKHK
ncbi:hypothetical protein [Reichenbachiella agariperforans]|uniref:SpoIIAA-like n=1 Tax=Reichenbachiella agariperforans TaxID=156994 RepID=A0A1M6VIM7_REIAG|nr:hypothetical protein [Reichenbachiella agariperforans]MBU2914445.1 hypothetical protein [Reichenbachiella agariperforans]SHK81407.1 hypothetical protein SAMN04488028_10969 [Reichenbachiella agariperforans]